MGKISKTFNKSEKIFWFLFGFLFLGWLIMSLEVFIDLLIKKVGLKSQLLPYIGDILGVFSSFFTSISQIVGIFIVGSSLGLIVVGLPAIIITAIADNICNNDK